MSSFHIFCDGCCIPHPNGYMGHGFVVFNDDGNIIHKDGGGYKPHENNTNNKAEYHALSAAIQYLSMEANMEDIDSLYFYSDSQLLINQMNGIWAVKSPSIMKLYGLCNKMITDIMYTYQIDNIKFIWIPREENKEADKEANRQLNRIRYGNG